MEKEELRIWRKTRGLTQAQAGELVGMTRRAWQSWERAERPIPGWLPLMLALLEENKNA